MSQGKFWCFTNFNLSFDYNSLGADYYCYGVETCPTTGNVHHQGYCEFSTNRRLTTLKKLENTIHWETRKGTQDEAIDYCSKDGQFIEHGTKKEYVGKGKRTDLDQVKKLVAEGKGMGEIYEVCTSFQALRFAEAGLKYKETKRTWKPNVYWYWGATGTGKTKLAVEQASIYNGADYNFWMSGKNLKWFEGYDAHKNVIFDDFRPEHCEFSDLLRLLDRYEYRVECKGGSRQFLAENIWITTTSPPESLYHNKTDEHINQLLRRITTVKEFKHPF